MSADIEYYTRREQQERESAERSVDSAAKMAHLQMANRYAVMVRDMTVAVPPAVQA